MKNYVLLFLIAFSNLNALGQSYEKQSRFNISSGLHLHDVEGLFFPLASFSPRFTIKSINENLNLSLEQEISFILQSNSQTGTSIVFDFPLTLNLNLGQDVANFCSFPLGVFTGLGYGGTFLPTNFDHVFLHGPITQLGIRAHVFNLTYYLKAGLQIVSSSEFASFEMLHIGLGTSF